MAATKKANVKAVKTANKLTVEERAIAKELEGKIKKMKADKENKCKLAKEQLISSLEVTVDKYRTATGTAEALRTLRFVIGDDNCHPSWANKLAHDMAKEVEKMVVKAKKLSYAEMDKLCEGFYEQDFLIAEGNEIDDDIYHLAFEMLRIDLCRNVGGAAEDMVSFIKRTQEEIDATGEKLKELRAKEGK